MTETTPPPPPSDAGAPPPPPPAHTEEGAPPPPPQKKSRLGVIIVAAVVVLALVLGGAIAAVLAFTGSDSHKIVTPSEAAGMKRDTAKEKQLQTQLDAAEQQFKTQAKHISYVRSAVYHQKDKDRGPEGALVFLGAKLTKKQDPADFVSSFEKQAKANGFKVSKVSAGEGDGKAVCASQEASSQKVAICAWATEDSMGELVPTVPGWDSGKLGSVLRDLRADVEQKA